MPSSELITRVIAEHNDKVAAAAARLAAKRQLRAETAQGFEQHERQLKAFNRATLAHIDSLIAADAEELEALGAPISTFEPAEPAGATVLDMTVALRRPGTRRGE